jgi:8-oxo-dGTP pyrophosphatase MutT (NUDIX family)
MALRLTERLRAPRDNSETVAKAIKVAKNDLALMDLRPRERREVDLVAKALRNNSVWNVQGAQSGTTAHLARSKPVSAQVLARQTANSINPSGSTITPIEIENALHEQGIDWVSPFAPGRPLTPYFGYNRRPRERDYDTGRNISTQTRPGRMPFETIRHLITSYDVATICYRHAIQDLRSMRVRFEVMDGYEENCVKEIAAAKEFWRRPDKRLDPESGKVIAGSGNTLRNWLCKHATDVWRFDCGTLYRQRDRAGRLISLPVADGTLFAPMLDYFGAEPIGEAPAFQQFIQGIPWDWLRSEDLIYEPMWPHTEDPYGIAPIETVLVNANTDLRLQTYFLQFFTTGNVPEAFAMAPEDQSDPDSLAEWQEDYNDWTYGDQSERWGLRWLPHGTEIEFYKPQQFDPDIAEYVMRRTTGAFMMMPQDLGFTDDVNRSTSDTQMDTQFRINSLPHVGYYEDIMDAITQEDLGLPVQLRFDTGREKEDRLMEAQSHQIYVSIGAESPDEVRDKVLGYPINPEEKVPRFFDSNRLGPIPISYLLGVAGDVDPLTGAPRPGTVRPIELVLPGTPGPDPDAPGPPAYSQARQHDTAAGRKVPARPKVGGPLGPGPLTPAPTAPLVGAKKPAASNGSNPARPRGSAAPGRVDQGTASRRTLKEATAGIGIATGIAGAHYAEDPDDPEDEIEEKLDLKRWKRASQKRVAKNDLPRHFDNSAISTRVYDAVWTELSKATTREEVDAAFAKATAGVHSPVSTMVSLDVPPGLIPVMENGVPDQHITIVYCGKIADDATFEKICAVAARVASAQRGPMSGTIGGRGTFPASESSDWLIPVWAKPEIPGIEALRGPLEQFNGSQHSDFHPHMTLAYMDSNEDLPAPIPPTPVTFTHLSVHRGDECRVFAFGGAAKAHDSKGPEVAGVALVARDSGKVLLVRRGNKDDDGNGASWETPAGHLDDGESAHDAAVREWSEETGCKMPTDAKMVGTWRSDDGIFQGFVYSTDSEDDVSLGEPDGDEIAAVSWWDTDDLDDKVIRDKVREGLEVLEPILEQAQKATIDYSGRLILPEPLEPGDTVMIVKAEVNRPKVS